jgi:hypothetical protein
MEYATIVFYAEFFLRSLSVKVWQRCLSCEQHLATVFGTFFSSAPALLLQWKSRYRYDIFRLVSTIEIVAFLQSISMGLGRRVVGAMQEKVSQGGSSSEVLS